MAKIVAQGYATLAKLNETIQIKLSNDIAAISCYSDGVPKLGAFTTADTYVEGFRGSGKISSTELKIGELITSKGVEATAIGNRIFINNLTEMSGYVDIPVSLRENFLGVYRFNAVKQIDGLEAASVRIVGENVFKYSNTNKVSPEYIHLSAIVQNIKDPEFSWYYKNEEDIFEIIPTDKYGALIRDSLNNRLIDSEEKLLYTSAGTLRIPSEDDLLWGERKNLVIRCSVSKQMYDEFTITKIKDGSEAYTVVLTNENHSFAADEEGNIKENVTTTTEVVCYKGTERITPASIELPKSKPLGLEWKLSENIIEFTASEGSSLAETGIVPVEIKIEEGISIQKYFSWTKVKNGKVGQDGAPGLPGAPGPQGEAGKPGVGYALNITGGNRGIAYSAVGTNPEPETAGTFSVELLKNGEKISPTRVSWIARGNYSGSSSEENFSPSVSKTYNEVSTFVRVDVWDGQTELSQTVPIVCTKHADGLDWLEDWNSNSVIVDKEGRKIISPKMFAGTKDSSGRITGVALGRDVMNRSGESQITGVVGYKDDLPVFSLSDKADFYVSSKGNAGSVVNGSANGMYFDGKKLYITGAMKLQNGTTFGDSNTSIDDVVNSVNKFPTSVKEVAVEYAINNSSKVPPTDGWSANAPEWREGSFIWTRNKTTLMNGATTHSDPVCLTGQSGAVGPEGKPGKPGEGVRNIVSLYKIMDTKEQQEIPSSDIGWETTPPRWSQGKYIHTCSKITYTSNRVEYTKPMCDSSWEAVNEIQVGGRNLARNSGNFKNASFWNTNGGTDLSIEDGCLKTTFSIAHYPTPVEPDKTYTISMVFKTDAETLTPDESEGLHFHIVADNEEGLHSGKEYVKVVHADPYVKGKFLKYVYEVKVRAGVENPKLRTMFYRPSEVTINNNLWIKTLKVEVGNKATDWTPAPEDVQAGIEANAQGVTDALNGASNAESLANKVTKTMKDITLEVDGNTKINGDLIANGTITGNAIRAGSFTIHNAKENRDTFSIDSDGGVKIDGVLQSKNFDIFKNTGYRISPDGKAILNQAEIRGDIKLPNAGITNFGAQIGERNLARNSQGMISKGESKDSAIVNGSFTAGQKITISADFDCVNLVGGRQNRVGIEGEIKLSNGSSLWLYVWHSADEGDFAGRKSFTQTIPPGTTGTLKRVHWYGELINAQATTRANIGNLKVEVGATDTPWCAAPEDNSNPVRFWAGKSYESRNNAPFQVKQNGDVVANNVLLSGRLTGDLDSEHLHITKGTFVIDGRHTYMEKGELRTISSRAPVEYVRLSSGQCVLNTDVSFGNNNIQYFKSNNALILDVKNIKAHSYALSLELNDREGLHTRGPSGGHHLFTSSSSGTKQGALIISSEGVQSNEGDVIVTRKMFREKCQVKIDGSLTIDENLKSTKNKMELKADSEGWGFYAY